MPKSRFLVIATLAASWTTACSVDWSLDPTAKDFQGKGGGSTAMTGGGGTVMTGGGGSGGTGGSAAGGGGTGGAPCDPVACPPPRDECQVAACVDGQCGSENKPDSTPCGVDGALQCLAGACQCTDSAQCAPAECNDVACRGGLCVYTPNTALTCGMDGTGSCGADGLCGPCGDGVQNGAENGVDCGPDTQCGACPGEPCSMNETCGGGQCEDGVCCDAACDGKCMGCTLVLTGLPDGSCGPLALGENDPDDSDCNNEGGCGAEPGYCLCEDGQANGGETDVDCGGTCGATCTTGLKCGDNGDCTSSNDCVDGFCCSSTCTGACRACDDPAHPGICAPLTVDVTSDCSDTQQCDGALQCEKANGQSCSNDDSDCASGLCENDVCTECHIGTNPCNGTNVCVGGVCLNAPLMNGATCLDGAQCTSNYCVDGVCCESACGGFCMACHLNYTGQTSGTCSPMLGGYDPQGECPGPGAAATCSGQDPDVNGDSACGPAAP